MYYIQQVVTKQPLHILRDPELQTSVFWMSENAIDIMWNPQTQNNFIYITGINPKSSVGQT
jgi:hypothetical protein